jgi:hypothetical protein
MLGGAVLAVACGGDDGTVEGTSSGSTGTSSGTSGQSSGTSGQSSGTSGQSSGTSGTPGPSSDAGAEGGDGGKKANGEQCSGPGAGNAECESGHCVRQGGGSGGGGGGSGEARNVCTIPCTPSSSDDNPTCTGDVFTGRCTGQGYCQVKN